MQETHSIMISFLYTYIRIYLKILKCLQKTNELDLSFEECLFFGQLTRNARKLPSTVLNDKKMTFFPSYSRFDLNTTSYYLALFVCHYRNYIMLLNITCVLFAVLLINAQNFYFITECKVNE